MRLIHQVHRVVRIEQLGPIYLVNSEGREGDDRLTEQLYFRLFVLWFALGFTQCTAGEVFRHYRTGYGWHQLNILWLFSLGFAWAPRSAGLLNSQAAR